MVKLLFVGDIHLGRAPTRLPDSLGDFHLTPHDCGPAAAWAATVELALRRRPDGVVLAGDVVESENARFEAYPHLARGVDRLVKAGIRVCGVAGNHDREALPRLAASIPDFVLLGPGGTWSTCPIHAREGGDAGKEEIRVHVAGWSFPGHAFPDRLPLEDFPAPADGHPVLGVVHCDLDATRSAYAPVSRAALQRTGAAGWFLGHIHKPSLTQEPHPIGYLGSLVGLDPTETGPRGPWWVEVTPDRDVRLTHLPLAPLRWDAFEMAVDPHLAPEDVFDRVRQAAQDHHDRLEKTELAHVRVLGLRLRVTGTVDRPGRLAREWPASGQIMTLGERLAFFDRIQDDTRPAVDLEELAASQGPPALLARALLDLESGHERAQALINTARARMQTQALATPFAQLPDPDTGDEAVRNRLLHAARRALDALLDQLAPPDASLPSTGSQPPPAMLPPAAPGDPHDPHEPDEGDA